VLIQQEKQEVREGATQPWARGMLPTQHVQKNKMVRSWNKSSRKAAKYFHHNFFHVITKMQ
jgi:hypothetical protein